MNQISDSDSDRRGTVQTYRCVSPVDGRVYAERPLASPHEMEGAITIARRAARAWGNVAVEERAAACTRFVEAFLARRGPIAEELTWQMGRPLRDTPAEVDGVEERARAMIALAPEALADEHPPERPGYDRFIRREPLGVVFVLSPWNYPYLTAVNAVLPAVMAGNAVVLKHSEQTFLCAERFAEAFEAAGLPEGVFQPLHLSHEQCAQLIASEGGPDAVWFTGSVAAGAAVQRSAAQRSDRFVHVGLELGGKDAAYVRADADLGGTANGLVEGAFYNAGQSCCGVERIYVDGEIYEEFVERYEAGVRALRLGNPLEPGTTLGPLARARSADAIREQVREAIAAGADAVVSSASFPGDEPGTPYLGPTVLTAVDHRMRVMAEETFGPVVGIMKTSSDDEAAALVNDSAYGLTASIWTADERAAEQLGNRLDVGTVFMNRCDYLDPLLAWTGVKASGRGVTLSRIGYEQLTRPKSFHLRRQRSSGMHPPHDQGLAP